jgi:hypothetical protein
MTNSLMVTAIGPSHYLSAAQQRLLGGWRDVTDDIRLLCRRLAELPEECRCGSGAALRRPAPPPPCTSNSQVSADREIGMAGQSDGWPASSPFSTF